MNTYKDWIHASYIAMTMWYAVFGSSGLYMSNQDLIQLAMDTCENQTLCAGSKGKTKCKCSCDTDCSQSLSCCPDMDTSAAQTVFPWSRFLPHSTCEHFYHDTPGAEIFKNQHPTYVFPKIRIVTKCPDGHSCKTGTEQSEETPFSLELTSRVYDSDGTIFYNQRCAECHGIRRIISVPKDAAGCQLPFNLIERSDEEINAALDECMIFDMYHQASLLYQPHIEYCSTIDACNTTGLWDFTSLLLQEACQDSFWEQLQTDEECNVYKNIYCFTCNQPANNGLDISNCLVIDIKSFTDKKFFSTMDKLISLNVVLNPHSCIKQHIWDKFTRTCKRIDCPVNRRATWDGKCFPTNYENVRYGFTLRLTPVDHDFILYENTELPPFCEIYEQFLREANVNPDCLDYYSFYAAAIGINGSAVFISKSLLWEKENNSLCAFSVLLKQMNDFSLRKYFMTQNSTYGSSFTRLLVEWHEDTFYGSLFPFKPVISYEANLTEICVQGLYPVHTNVLPLQKPFNCLFIQLTPTELEELFDGTPIANLSLDIMKYFHPVLQPMTFLEDLPPEGYRVCYSDYQNLMNTIKRLVQPIKATPQGLLSLVLTALSLVSIVLTLIILQKQRSIKNEPQIILIFSLANIFIAQSLFQFGTAWTSEEHVCTLIAILVHYFWLSTVFSFNAFCVLVDQGLQAIHVQMFSKRLLLSLAYVYGLPVFFIAANVVSAQFYVSNFLGGNFGYGPTGLDGICFLQFTVLRGCLFVLPVFLTVVCNIIVYIHIVRQIRAISDVTSTRSAYKYAVTYFRLLIISGAAWLVGFLNEFVQSEAVNYLFTILLCGQGIIMFLSFLIGSGTVCKCERVKSQITGLTASFKKSE